VFIRPAVAGFVVNATTKENTACGDAVGVDGEPERVSDREIANQSAERIFRKAGNKSHGRELHPAAAVLGNLT